MTSYRQPWLATMWPLGKKSSGRLAARRGSTSSRPLVLNLPPTLWLQARAWGFYDPEPDLRRCITPMLAVLGADDPLVPVQDSIEVYRRSAILAAREQTFACFPGGRSQAVYRRDWHAGVGILGLLDGVAANSRHGEPQLGDV